MSFRPDIQGLRAVAVLAVIIFHVNPTWLPGGFVGVDIFLVISGYLIAGILLHKKVKADYRLLPTLGYFYSSRLKRIAPAYFTTLVVTSLIAAVLFLPADFSTYRDGLKQAAWFNSNNYFADFSDYFAPANHEQPLLHTWSLAVEIQFYLIAPFIFLLIARKHLQWLLPTSVVVLTAYAEYRLEAGIQQASYYSLLARLPAFFLGGCVALWIGKKNRPEMARGLNLSLGVLATVLIAYALINPKPTGHFPGLAGLIPTLAAALIIWLNANNKISVMLSGKIMVWIGGLSYSLYLWHWPVLAFMRYYTGAEILSWQFSLAFIVITLALAAASYYWIEAPQQRKRSGKQILGYGCLVLVALATAVGIKDMNKYFTPDPLPVEYTRYADPATVCQGKIVGDCLKGKLSSKKEVLVLGDSHAAMLNGFFDYLGEEIGFKARIITAPGCVTIAGFDYERIHERSRHVCLDQTNVASKYIAEADAIFIAAIWSRHLQSNKFVNSITEFLRQHEKNKSIFLLAQEPLLKFNPQRAMRFSGLGFHPDFQIDMSYLSANHKLSQISQGYGNVYYLNFGVTEIFNNAPFAGKELIYYDAHHLNQQGAMHYAKAVKSHMAEIFKSF